MTIEHQLRAPPPTCAGGPSWWHRFACRPARLRGNGPDATTPPVAAPIRGTRRSGGTTVAIAPVAAVPLMGGVPTVPSEASGQPVAAPRRPFAHASEAELARILDFYEVRWEYEPHLFPILWNLDGAVVESFSPDFYLPDFDLYVELTTLRQPLVRKKNRKLRRLRELYPDVRIKLFYARDFRALMLKFGKLALADGISGTLGQVVPNAAAVASASADPPVEEGSGSGTSVRAAAAGQADPAIRRGTGASTRRRRERRGRRAGRKQASDAIQAARRQEGT